VARPLAAPAAGFAEDRGVKVTAHRRLADRLRQGRARLRALPGGAVAVRIVVTVLGVAVIAIGIVLLPLPGPGWLIIFAGLGLLATEYTWAARLLRHTRRYVEAWTRWALRQRPFIRALVGLGGLLFVGAILVACWWLLM
jgi:uncharacterized protein (TIGR02611 family)